MYVALADATFAVHVMPKTAGAEIAPAFDRKAPNATAVSAGTGGKTFSIAARTAMVR